MKLNPYFIQYTNINSRWIKDLNIRPEIIKLLEENREGKFLDIGRGNDFLDLTLTKRKGNRSKIKVEVSGWPKSSFGFLHKILANPIHHTKKLLHSKESH